jgi:hypothetical protein
MGVPVSLLLIAGGAILAFAVTGSPSGVDLHSIGWILLVAGIVGLVLSMIVWDSWAGGGYWRNRGPRAPRRPPHP